MNAPADPTAFDRRAFRDALGRYATGVAIVMARCPEGRTAGMTINSFASVSLTPPLVLWSMQQGTSSGAVFHAAPGFSVSILGDDQQAAAMSFAKSDGGKLDSAALEICPSGLPRIAGAAAWFDCRVAAVHPGGDHDIFLGEVAAFGARAGSTLLFHDGRFGVSGA
jgi:flavin reductase (DIM6/NTAB) family NADH-FMN oxidoreductase RutF